MKAAGNRGERERGWGRHYHKIRRDDRIRDWKAREGGGT